MSFRPHGQHSVILAEDALKFIDHRKDKNDTSPTVSSARQIYMTFPADSSFTEDDVSDYFRQNAKCLCLLCLCLLAYYCLKFALNLVCVNVVSIMD